MDPKTPANPVAAPTPISPTVGPIVSEPQSNVAPPVVPSLSDEEQSQTAPNLDANQLYGSGLPEGVATPPSTSAGNTISTGPVPVSTEPKVPHVQIDPAPPIMDIPDEGVVSMQQAAEGPVPTWPPQGSIPPAAEQASAVTPSFNPASPAVGLSESAPTDLSHLATALGVPGAGSEANTKPGLAPLPVSTDAAGTAEPTATVVTSGSSGISKKILIIGGILILVAVTGMSAYFILGIGKNQSDTTSLPAQQQLTAPPQLAVTPTPTPPVSSATTPATFGGLNGASPSAQVATSSATTNSTDLSVFDRRKTNAP